VHYVRLADNADVLGTQLTAEGVVVKTPYGCIANPKSKILGGFRSCLLRFSAVLGLDPTSRARLEATGVLAKPLPPKDDEDARIFA